MAPFACLSDTGPGPCMNPTPHQAPKNCVHYSSCGSWVDDHHRDKGHG